MSISRAIIGFVLLSLCTAIHAAPIVATDLLNNGKQTAEINEALGLIQQGDLSAARRQLESILEKQPKDIAARLALADVFFGRGQAEEAGEQLSMALDAGANNAAAHTAMGRWQVLQGNSDQAVDHFSRAIALDSNLVDPEIELASLYMMQFDNPPLAEKHYSRAIELAPERIDIRYAFAVVLAEQGDIDSAMASIDAGAEREPENPYPWQLRATILASNGQHAQALDSLKQARTRAPSLSQVHWAMGELYMSMGDANEAINSFEQVLKIDPKHAAAHTRIGLIHQIGGDFSQAEQAYMAALAIDPELALAYNNLAYGAAKAGGRHEEALAWSMRAVELQPANAEFVETLAMVHESSGNTKDAIAVLEQLVLDYPDFTPAKERLDRLRSAK